MTTDWRERSELSDSNPAQASGNPSSSQAKHRVACQRCFRRKQKCDRIRPACTSCAAQGVECIARSQQFDFDSEETGLTPARVNGYVESLKRRVAELEQKVKAAEISHVQTRRSFNSDITLPINGKRRRSTEGYVPVVNAETDNTWSNGEDQSTVEDTMSAIGLLSNRAMAESRAHIGNEPHKLSMIESISAALAVDGQDPSKASASSSHHIPLNDDQPIALTPDLTSIYIQRFIDWSVWLPHIDESHLMQQYHAVVDSDGTDQPSLHRFNTYLSVAIGISMSSEKGRLTALATNLHSTAVKLLPSILHSQEPFDTLHSASFLDAYTILAAAVVYLCLVQTPHPNQQGFAQTFEVVSKASVLLTQCSTRFIAISVFQQFLLSLSTKIMEGPASVQEYLEFIPLEIPIHLRSLVQSYASLSTRTG
ncbi:hypothetical protein HYE68_000037 [Fusarium pseudograminearum]|nr:hypothetical protein HYE68_000037 [Fusarium pseudograminearum]